MNEITREFLIKECACTPGFKWWENNLEGKGLSTPDQLRKIAEHNWLWANHVFTTLNLLNLESLVKYAEYSAKVSADSTINKDDQKYSALHARECAESAAMVRIADASCSAALAANWGGSNKILANKILEYGIKLLEEQEDDL